jgi:Phage integrase family
MMMLTEVLEATISQAHIPASRHKDLKTAIRYLAKALGKEAPEHCHDTDFLVPEAIWKQQLNTYFGALTPLPSIHTVRNTRNNLRYLLRQAHAHGIIHPIQHHTTAERHPWESPYASHYIRRRYWLPVADWPPAVRAEWERYRHKRQLNIRASTLTMNERFLKSYMGYLVRIAHIKLTQWDDLFRCEYLDRFVRWHSEQCQVRISSTAKDTAMVLRTIARHEKHQYVKLIEDYVKALPDPEPMHDKKHHWFTLLELEHIARIMLSEARKPLYPGAKYYEGHAGIFRSMKHAMALMLRILVRIPLRQRNLREMRRERNLYQDQNRDWRLTFKGEELKVGIKKGRPNILTVNLSQRFPDIIPHLEEYLHSYRPTIPNAGTSEFVFLTRYGNPYIDSTLVQVLQYHILRYTGKRFYPHLVRTIYFTEMIERGLNLDTVAYMLNDNLATAVDRYYELFGEHHVEKASRVLQSLFTTNGSTAS